MKKIIYLAGLCVAMSFSSCDDFLSVESPDEMTTDNFWRNESDAQAGLSAVYSQLYHGDTYATSEVRWTTEEYRADIVKLGSDAGNYDQWTQLYNFNYTNGNTQFSYYYQDLYRGINFANQVIFNVPNIPSDKITDEVRKTILEEAHFLRGYYHMMLLLNWKDIIIRDEYVVDVKELNKPLSPRVDCWNFVIEEFKAALNLPDKRSDAEMGRATSGAAYSYLGFAYLTRAYEETGKKAEYLKEAVKAFEQVESKGYELVSGNELIGMFDGTNKNCDESIFEVQYSRSEANGSVHYSFINQWIGAKEIKGYDEILPSEMLMKEYKKEGKKSDGLYDNRLYNTVYYQCDYFNEEKRVLGFKYDELFCEYEIKKNEQTNKNDTIRKPGTEYNKPVFRKFTSRSIAQMQDACDFNIPLMRYANVLLMKAEALNELGDATGRREAIILINRVRSEHGGMSPMTGTTYEEVKAQIEHERILEFPLESYRWYDLRRWGKTAEALQAAGRTGFDDSKLFYPIPKWELDANPEVK